MKIIDLFAGCGGLSLGFIKNQHDIVTAVEFDQTIASTYKANHPNVNVVIDDIMNIDDSDLFKQGDADIIIGGPPCQGFSMAGARIRNGFINDPRNYLFKHYFNVVKKVKPKAFIMENVKGIMTMQNGEIFKEILKIFSDPNLLDGQSYTIHFKLVKAVEFGIPQKRERMIIVGTLNNNYSFDSIWDMTKEEIKKDIPTFFDSVTVRDAIGNLGDTTESGQIKNPKATTEYEKYLSSSKEFIFNHKKTNHSDKAILRMKKIQAGENYEVLDEKIKSVHSGAYGRLDWDKPSQTITTRFDTPAGGRFIHPEMNRTLSPREAARLQSFSDDFIFYGNKTSICKQIGNAVPPKISYFLSRLIDNMLMEKECYESIIRK